MTARPSSGGEHNSQPEYSVFPVPVPVSKEHLEKYIALRLLGLKTDPRSFGSTHESSLLYTEADWRGRIDSVDKVTLVASSRNSDEWIGTMIILSPEAISAGPSHWIPPSDVSEAEVYVVIGTWVHPEHRQKGVGRMLMERGRDWIRDRRREKGISGLSRLLLQVYSHNIEAVKLYSAAGFERLEGEEIDGDRTKFSMVSVLNDE